MLYFVDGTSGRLFRTRNARDAAEDVAYEDLGVVDAGGLNWIGLDEFDPVNRAMVCGPNGIWRTTNLNDATPTWTNVLDLSGNNRVVNMVCSSSRQQDLWLASGYDGDDSDNPGIWGTDDGGDNWTAEFGFIATSKGCLQCAKIELSTHDPDLAWLSLYRVTGEKQWQAHIDIIWNIDPSGAPAYQWSLTYWPAAMFLRSYTGAAPYSYHRYTNNTNDNEDSLWCGGRIGSPNEAKVNWLDRDIDRAVAEDVGGTDTILGTGGNESDTLWIGGYRGRDDRYWALVINDTSTYEFHISDDGVNWTHQYTFTGTMQYALDWRDDDTWFYATQDGAAAPLLISSDRGATWQTQTGNWTTLGYTGDIRCCAAVWTL